MARRVVVFGATGFTGGLLARALSDRGVRPVLAGRDATRLGQLSDELDSAPIAVAHAEQPETVRALVEAGDVLVSTVGPFLRVGSAAVEAALQTRAHYLDSAGEGTFIRDVFERHGPRAASAGCALIPAFGFDFVPGNLAARLALREAGRNAVAVDVVYVAPGAALSGGTVASALGMGLEDGFSFRGGRVVRERIAARQLRLRDGDRTFEAVSVPGSEHLTLPVAHRGLREVGVYLAWRRRAVRPLQAMSAGTSLGRRVPGFRQVATGMIGRLAPGSTGGPGAERRARARSRVFARALASDGTLLAETRLEGPDPYDLTAALLAFGAQTMAETGPLDFGALGPVEAFGLDELRAGLAEAGMRQV